MGKRNKKGDQLLRKAAKLAKAYGAELGPTNLGEQQSERRDCGCDADSEEMEHDQPSAATYDDDHEGIGAGDWSDMQVAYSVDGSNSLTLYSNQVDAMFRVDGHPGHPPFVWQAATNAVEAVVFPLPGWDENKEQISDKFYVSGFARVASASQESQGDDDQSSFVFFCNCCEDGQQVWVDVLFLFELPGECKKSSTCLHAQFLEKFVERCGGFDRVMHEWRVRGTEIPIFFSSVGPVCSVCVCHFLSIAPNPMIVKKS